MDATSRIGIPPAPRRLTAAGLDRLRLLVFGQSAQVRAAEVLMVLLQAGVAVLSLATGRTGMSMVLFATAAITCAIPIVRRLACGAKVERLRYVCERGVLTVGTLTRVSWNPGWTPGTKKPRPVCTVWYQFTDDRGREQSKREVVWGEVELIACEVGGEVDVLFNELDPRQAIAPSLHGMAFE